MKRISYITLGVVLVLFIPALSLAAVKPKPLAKARGCTSPVEGFFHSYGGYLGKIPVLLTKRMGRIVETYGRIVEQREDGYVFLEDQPAMFGKVTPKFYPRKDIVALVDSTGAVIYGELPDRLSTSPKLILHLDTVDQPKSARSVIELSQNKKFGFCLEPGVYRITDIRIAYLTGKVDQAIAPPAFTFVVENGCSNYIGDIFLNFESLERGSRYSIECKEIEHPGGGAGMFFGFVGAVIEEAAKDIRASSGNHCLNIVDDSTFVPSSVFDLKHNCLTTPE